MAVTDHLKPLFNKRLLQDALRAASPPITDGQRQIAIAWARSAATGALAQQKERPLQGQFLSEIFDRLLGFKQLVGAETGHHMDPETSSKQVKGYKPPDARLGWFGVGVDQTRAVVELKAPGADLDAKQAGHYGHLTPVEQAFGYAVKTDGCRWVIVSNFVSIRLYRTDRGQGYCHNFQIAELADERRLAEFLFLLGRESLLGASPAAESPAHQLASHTHVEEQRITQAFYVYFRNVRLDLFYQLRHDNPVPPGVDGKIHEHRLLEQAQKILDRVLFICFCEDTGLLPPRVLRTALTANNAGFVRVSHWQQLCGLFDAVDKGHPPMQINGYNGGLFAKDAALDALAVTDEILDKVLALANYDFETDLNVNILGHIFEQSISDLEAIRAEIRGEATAKQDSKRKRDGIFYTPEFITRFIVARTIGGWLKERFVELEARHKSGKPGLMSKAGQQRLWRDYLELLGNIKVLDLACGSGAFLIAAFDFLFGEYERVNRTFAELTGSRDQIDWLDLDRQILQENLFGVDLNPESVEITKLSLWLKTARKDKPLNNLDGNIRCGNSLVEPPAAEALRRTYVELPPGTQGFDWREAFPAVAAKGGFDIVIGNPPYVRQESIGPFKPYLQQRYASYHGAADLYVYFYERGLELLAPTGKLSYIVTNKWLRAGYGEPLRRLFSERAEFEDIIDFGHAPIFEDADTFPCIIVAHPNPSPPAPLPSGERGAKASPPMGGGVGERGLTENSIAMPETADDAEVRVCLVPRDRPTELSLDQYITEQAYPVPWRRYGAKAWSLEPPAVEALMARIRKRGVPLSEFAGVKPMYGIKTGFNEAFLIDDATRLDLIRDDPGCAEIIKPYLRGQDIKRWVPEWQRLWMIVLASSGNRAWSWSDEGGQAEAVFNRSYPSVYQRMKGFEDRLRNRQDKGQFWWELRACDYYDRFESPKLVYQEIQFHPQYALSNGPLYGNNKVFLLPSDDAYLLACLNSPLLWWFNWRNLPHMKDEALNPAGFLMESLPIAEPSLAIRAEVEDHTGKLIELTAASQRRSLEISDWLRLEFGIAKPGQKLEAYADLTADAFATEVRQRRPKSASRLSPVALADLKQTHQGYAAAERERMAEILQLERRVADRVNQAYGLDEEDIALLWQTAPPRMPFNDRVHGA